MSSVVKSLIDEGGESELEFVFNAMVAFYSLKQTLVAPSSTNDSTYSPPSCSPPSSLSPNNTIIPSSSSSSTSTDSSSSDSTTSSAPSSPPPDLSPEPLVNYASRLRTSFEAYRKAQTTHRNRDCASDVSSADSGADSGSSTTSDFALMDLDDEEEFPPLHRESLKPEMTSSSSTPPDATTTTMTTPMTTEETEELCRQFAKGLLDEDLRVSLEFRRTMLPEESWEETLKAAVELEEEIRIRKEEEEEDGDSETGSSARTFLSDFGLHSSSYTLASLFDSLVFQPIDYSKALDFRDTGRTGRGPSTTKGALPAGLRVDPHVVSQGWGLEGARISHPFAHHYPNHHHLNPASHLLQGQSFQYHGGWINHSPHPFSHHPFADPYSRHFPLAHPSHAQRDFFYQQGRRQFYKRPKQQQQQSCSNDKSSVRRG